MSNDRTLYDVEVPEGERLPSRRTPDAYRVIVRDKWQPCMVLGLYHGQWHDHPGNDWLIRHLLEKKTEADATIDRLERENRELRGRLTADDTDIADDPDCQAFVQEQAKHCRCSHGPCDGVLAGGPCDEIRYDDEEDDENFPDDEEEDIEGYAT